MADIDLSFALVLSAGAFAASCAGAGVVAAVLRRRSVFDIPNRRSSHKIPVPRGGGLAVIPVILIAWAIARPEDWPILAAAAGLAAVSWLDDLGGVPAPVRLLAQFVAVGSVLWALPFAGPVFGGLLPKAMDTVLTAVLWVWFVNAFNFMDGIDAISAVETAVLGIGAFLIALLTAPPPSPPGLIAAAAGLGFLVWNRPPAKIFLGDVGSVGLGFLCGWLLLDLAARGQPAAAAILAAYYLADTTITLARRVWRGERVWQAHRDHYYQRAVRAGRSHGQVATQVALTGAGLIGCACVATVSDRSWAGIAVAVALVGFALVDFGKRQ